MYDEVTDIDESGPACLSITYNAVTAVKLQQQRQQQSIHATGPDLQNIVRQSYDDAEVTIDLERRTSNLHNILHRTQGVYRVQQF